MSMSTLLRIQCSFQIFEGHECAFLGLASFLIRNWWYLV